MINKKKVLLSLSVFCGIVLFAGICTCQDKIRELKTMKPYKNSPVLVVSKELNSKSLIENKIEAKADWLKHLAIGIQNVSQKDITLININLLVETKPNWTAVLAVPLIYHPGTEPDPQRPGESKKRVLAPDEVIKLTVEDHYYTWAMNTLRGLGVEDFGEIRIDVRSVTFADGTRWHVGFDLGPRPDTRKSSPVDGSKPFFSFFLPTQHLRSQSV